MRIGLVIYGSLATRSGGYLYDRMLVERLQVGGDEVEIFSLPWRSYAHHLGQNFIPGLAQRLEKADLDILLQDELNHPSLFLINRRLRHSRRYLVVSIIHHLRSSEDHPSLLLRFYRRIEKAYLQTLDGAVYNSQTTKRSVEALLGRPLPGMVVTPAGDRFGAGLSIDEIQKRALGGGPLRILFVGNLIPRKGLATLLRALARLENRDWQLRVAGSETVDPPHSAAMRRLTRDLALERQVDFLGSRDDRDLERELRQAHLLAVPSQYEGFGIVYLEGMGFGLPAIGTTAGGAGEIIQNGVDGLLIEPGDIAGLARGLSRLMNERNVLLRMSLAARRRFEDFPGWEKGMATLRQSLLAMRQEFTRSMR